MHWELSHRADLRSRLIADRHYNRQKPGTAQFVPPGRCCVLYAPHAFWVTSWPFAEYVKHAWAGAWVCSAFRREQGCEETASRLILEALAATRFMLGEPPELGIITFLDQRRVKPIRKRGKEIWGYTWQLAGFKHVGFTAGGLMAWQLKPESIPLAMPPLGTTMKLFD